MKTNSMSDFLKYNNIDIFLGISKFPSKKGGRNYWVKKLPLLDVTSNKFVVFDLTKILGFPS